jgi:hypothetical protein
VLIRISAEPGDIRRLLGRVAATLELAAARVPVPEEDDRFLAWRKERPE